MSAFKDRWLEDYAVVPVDMETTAALMAEVKRLRAEAPYAEEIIRLVGEETAKAGKLHREARRVMPMNEVAFTTVYCTLCELQDRIAALKQEAGNQKTENANERPASAVDVAAPQNVVLLGVRRADAAGPPVVRGEELRGRFAGVMVERGGGWVKVQRLSDEDADALVALLNGRLSQGRVSGAEDSICCCGSDCIPGPIHAAHCPSFR